MKEIIKTNSILKRYVMVIVIVISLIIGVIFAFGERAVAGSKISEVEMHTLTMEGIEETSNGKYRAVSDDSKIFLGLGGQDIYNLRLTVSGFKNHDEEGKARVIALSDGETIYDSEERKDKAESEHAFMIPRTLVVDRTIGNIEICAINAKGAEVMVEFNVDPVFNWFHMLVAVLISYIILTFAYCVKKGIPEKPELIASTLIIIVGLISALYVPVKYTFDEQSHYVRAYNDAELNLFYGFDQICNYPKGLFEVLTDKSWLCDNYDDYVNLMKYNDQFRINDTEESIQNSPQVVYAPLGYITSGIGVKIAQLLDLSVYRSVQLAKFVNVLFFALVAFFSIRIAPRNKLWFLFYFALPINIFFAASLGTDYFINAFIALSVAMLFKYKTMERKMSVREYVLVLLALCMVPCGKSPYAPVILLLGILGRDELPNRISEKMNYVIAVVVMMIVFSALTIYGSRYGIAHWGRDNVSPIGQVKHMIHHPLNAIYAYVYSFMHQFSGLVFHKYNGFAYIGNPEGVGLVSLTGLIMFSLIDRDETKKVRFDIWKWLFVALAVLGSYSLSWLALYTSFTPVGAYLVEGFQPRYCIPIALMIYFIIMLIQNVKLEFNNKKLPMTLEIIFLAYAYWGLIIDCIGKYI